MTFETVNASGAGQYYDGLPVDCPVNDELERELGDPLEASLAAALSYVESGTCPAFGGVTKPGALPTTLSDLPLAPSAGPGRRYAGIY